MAEETNQAAQEQPSTEQAVETSSAPAQSESSPNISLKNVGDNFTNKSLPAKPESIDLYKYVVGNPITGTDPGKNTGLSLDKVRVQTLNTPSKGYEMMRPYTYNGDFDGANFERYYKSPAYKTLGFSPYRDNEALYNNNMTFGDEFVRAASQWPSLVKTGFVSGVKAWGDMFTDPLAPDIESAREMKRAMAVGASSKGGVGGFITNTFLNSGYTVGIGLNLLGEELALMGATALTGGLSAEVTAPAMFSRLFGAGKKVAQGLDVAEDVVQATKAASKTTESYRAINNVNDARNFWNTIPGKIISKTGSVLNPLENTLQAVRATDYATDYAKVVGTFGAFARDVMMTKAAVSEAKLEAGMTKIDTTEELINLYRQQYGKDPEGADLQNIENIANQQATKTAVWNLPAIMWSNKFMYETMFAPIDKLVKPNLAKFADDIIFDKKTFAAAGEGFFARTKLAAKALKNPKVYGRYAFDYLKGNFAEGIQENLQEAIAKASADQAIALYKDPAMADYEGYMSYMMKGLGDQFSAQGAETFASGFLMSMFASPMMSAPSYAITKGLDLTVNKNKVAEAKAARDLQRKEEVDSLNDFYSNALAYLAPDLANAVKQQKMSDDLAQALEDGDILKARNIKDEAIFEHIHTALRTGKYDVILNKIKDYKNLSPEEAKEAFKEYGIEDGNQALKYIDKIIARAEKIKNTYESVSNQLPNKFNYKQYAKDNPLYKANLIAAHAWEEAKKKLIFSKDAFDTLSDRIEKMTQSFAKLSNSIAQADSQTFLSLMSPESAIREINTLKKEISVLDPALSEQKAVRKDKEKKLELFESFYDSVSKMKFAQTEEEKNQAKAEAKTNFENVLKYIAGKNDSIVFDKTIEDAYQTILDNMTLSDERKALVESINILSNPEGFLTVQRRLANVYNQIVDEKENTLKYNNDVFTGRRESNITLNAIYQATGLILKPEDLKALRDALINGTRIPKITSFVDKETEEDVSGDNAKFKVAKQIWEDRLPLIRSQEEIDEEAEEAERQAVIEEEIILEDSSTYPQELLDILEKEYNRRIAEGTLDESLTLDDYINTPFSRNIVRKYIKEFKEKQLAKQDIYSKFSLEELKQKYEALSKKEDKTPAEETELVNIENAIVNRELRSKLTPEQIEALKKLEAITKNAEKNEDESGYTINSILYNLRVTKLKDKILSDKYEVPEFNYADNTKPGTVLVDLFNKAVADISTKSKYPETEAKNIINFIKAAIEKRGITKTYENILTKSKVAELEYLLSKDPSSVENFKKALNSVAFKESKDTGNAVDEIARNYFEGKPIRKPSNMSDSAFRNLIQSLEEIRNKLQERGEFIVSKGIKVFGRYNIEGKEENVAGELDLLVIDKEGNFKIYDIKTSKKWDDFGTEEDKWKKKEGYTLQVSIYKKLLEDMLGIEVKELALLPLKTTTDPKTGNITAISNAFSEKNENITYDPIVEEYLQPSTIQDVDWAEMINNVNSEEELDALMDQIDAEDAMTPDLLFAINIKRNTFVPKEEKTEVEEEPYEQIDKYLISKPIIEKDGTESIIVQNKNGRGMLYTINTDENGSVVSLTPRNSPQQRITNERLLVAVEIKRNKYNYDNPLLNKIANSESAYNKAKTQIPILDLVENTLNFGLTDEILESVDKLYSNRKLTRDQLVAIQIWANSAATRLDNILADSAYAGNPELMKAWENMYIINELASNKLSKIKVPEAKEKREPVKSVAQIQKERDAELQFIQEKRQQLGIEFDPLEDLPLTVVVTMERFEAGLPIDPVSVFETSDWLYNKYKELTDMQLDPKRMLTIKQIKSYQKALEKDIRALEKYKQEQYGETIIPDEAAKSTSTPEQRRESVTREQKDLKETSFDEPIRTKTKRVKQEKVEKVKKEAKASGTEIVSEDPVELPKKATKKKAPTLVEKPKKVVVKKTPKGKKVTSAPTETETEKVNVDEFNKLSIEDKFKELSSELGKDGVVYGVYRRGEYDNHPNQSYEIVLDDGRVIRAVPTTFNKKDGDGNLIVPEGQRVALKKEQVEVDGKFVSAIGVYRLDETGNPKQQSFTNVRQATPKYETEKKNKNIKVQDLNKQEITVDTLEIAKEKGFEVIYRPIGSFEDSVNYLVKNIDRKGKKEVTLYSPLIPGDVVISIDSIPSVIKGIVDPNSANMTEEDKDQTLKNKQAIVKPTTSFDNKISEDDALNNLLNNLC